MADKPSNKSLLQAFGIIVSICVLCACAIAFSNIINPISSTPTPAQVIIDSSTIIMETSSTLTDYILIPDSLQATQEIAIENQTHGEARRDEKRRSLQEDRMVISREIANITRAIADAGHSQALLDALKNKEAERGQINAQLKELEIPIETIPDLTRPQLESASKRLVERLKGESFETRRETLRGIIHEVVAERDGDTIDAFITYYHPPPFDLAPTDVLSISRDPVGAHLYRQTFTYVAQSKARSR